MHNPRACVIGFEANGNVVGCRCARVDDVTSDWVVVVVNGASGTTNYGERMTVKMNGMLEGVWLDEIRLL